MEEQVVRVRRRENRRRKREKTISSVFFRYACFYTAGVLFWMFLWFMAWLVLDATGAVLPANHMEAGLNESADEIRKASKVTEELMPKGCIYGVYGPDGSWLYGTFPPEEAKQAWENYTRDSIYARKGGYYRFFLRDSGEVCIAKYEIAARFQSNVLETFLPRPDVLLVLSFVVLFLIHTVLVSRHFGRYMKKRMLVLNEVTAKIQNRDLEFEEEHSELKEVDEVLNSLNQMKEALKEALYRQWNLEKGREEQAAALAHDIKTPLTVIRGNAELLAESGLVEEEQEYAQDILQSVSMIEEYLTILNELLAEDGQAEEEQEYAQDGEFGTQEGTSGVQKTRISLNSLADVFMEQARLLASGRQFGIVFHREALPGEALCNENQILRAFQNILGNAMDYSPPEGGIEVFLEMKTVNGKEYLAVTVQDAGPGFTAQDLKHATEQFYQGDQSRSSKTHHGIGLHTAEKFIKAQGGFLEIGNAEKVGARVTISILNS